MIVITTIDTLPDLCYECPCHDGENGHCQADKERRYSDYRPFWCPLKEQEEMNIDAFIQWCIDSHIMGDATISGIKYWAGKFKEGQ